MAPDIPQDAVTAPSPTDSSAAASEPGLDSVSSLVTDAFARLTQLQEELRGRLRGVGAREAEAVERERKLDERTNEVESKEAAVSVRSDALRTKSVEIDALMARLDEREATVARREEVVAAFQEMIAHMHGALQDLAPAGIMAALDAGEAYEDRAVASAQSIGLTAEEQKRFFAERTLGKSDEEILADIYAARRSTSPHAA